MTPADTPFRLSGRIPELDGLRGIAIGLILIWHYFVMSAVPQPGTFFSYLLVFGRLTWTGVDLFFVLSGFLIGGILLDARHASNYLRVFYTRRFFRIVPVYFAVLALVPLVFVVTRSSGAAGFSWLTADALPAFPYWIFAQNFWMAAAATLGANAIGITWSLAIEEQFYLTLPWIVCFCSGPALLFAVLSGIVLAPAARIAFHLALPANWVPGFALMPCRADALLLGVLAAILLRHPGWHARIQRHGGFFTVAIPVLAAGSAFLAWKSPSFSSPLMQCLGYSWLALFYAVLLVYALTRPSSPLSGILRSRWLGWLGGIAYGTYLFHQTVQGLLFGYLWHGPPRISSFASFLTAVAALVLTLVIARLSWRFFERPLILFGHRSNYLFADRPAASDALRNPSPGAVPS